MRLLNSQHDLTSGCYTSPHETLEKRVYVTPLLFRGLMNVRPPSNLPEDLLPLGLVLRVGEQAVGGRVYWAIAHSKHSGVEISKKLRGQEINWQCNNDGQISHAPGEEEVS